MRSQWPTPARAGTTTRHARRRRGPHGPPPLARGPHAVAVDIPRGGRPTPARAGTTTGGGGSRARTGAHPRSRGDHAAIEKRIPTAIGPPPLARGPPTLGRAPQTRTGPTPARAGTTGAARAKRVCRGAHPRSRGDHVLERSDVVGHLGPPPLARGPQRPQSSRSLRAGPTPARAGTTSLNDVT